MTYVGDEFIEPKKNNSSANSCSFKLKPKMQDTHIRTQYYIVTKAARAGKKYI
jgi:hypothetical protein